MWSPGRRRRMQPPERVFPARTREDQSMTATGSPLTTADLAIVAQLARQLRIDSIRASTSAGSGHPTSSMSATDVLAVLVAHHLR
jgi:transketolase